jgi:maltose-binding protein MalE
MNMKTALVGAVLAVVAVVLLVVLSSGGSDSSSSTDAGKVPTIVVDKQGKPVGGIAELTYKKGDRIHFKVKVPFEEEVHLHGYDVAKEVPKGGGTVTYDLPAEIEGVFEAELEGHKEQILELKVEP